MCGPNQHGEGHVRRVAGNLGVRGLRICVARAFVCGGRVCVWPAHLYVACAFAFQMAGLPPSGDLSLSSRAPECDRRRLHAASTAGRCGRTV